MQSKEIPITVAARLIYHLGEQLISDELVALLELIKNSYDADATKCTVIVDCKASTPHGRGKITISDNGNGMLPHIVEKDFLRLATDYKKTNKISPFYKRRTLGEKGLGRLSYQRLGKYVTVTTSPSFDRLEDFVLEEDKHFQDGGYNTIDITMDWEGFSDSDDIRNVYATVTEKNVPNAKRGTTIVIDGIRNLGFWDLNQKKRERLNNEILALINPYIEAQKNAAFSLQINVNGELFYVDSIDEKIVDQLSDVSCRFSFNQESKQNILEIEATFKDSYINRQKNQYIERMGKDGFSLVSDVFSNEKHRKHQFSVDLSVLQNWKEKCQIDLKSVNLHNNVPAINFQFNGSLYIVDKLTANRTKIDKNIIQDNAFIRKSFQKIGQLWDSIAGVYLYRDQFRILPYGKNDWLDFTVRSQKGKATILKQGNVCGYIGLDGKKSEAIREQTNRQGILEDETGSNFLLIVNKIIVDQIFIWDVALRGEFTNPKFDSEKQQYCNSSRTIWFKKEQQAKDRFNDSAAVFDAAIHQVKEPPAQTSLFEPEKMDDRVKKLAKSAEEFRSATSELQNYYLQELSLAQNRIDEYEEILPLLGQTMLLESATHELSRIYTTLLDSAHELNKFSMTLSPPNRQLSNLLVVLRSHISELDLQLTHILPTQRYKLKDVQAIDIEAFLRSQYVEKSAVSIRLKSKEIYCKVEGSTFSVDASKGVLIVVFDNLIINSEYWLSLSSLPQKEIVFRITPESNSIQIWDTGLGIDKDIENTLFEPFRTMKRDGRGLGLFIVKEMLALMGASISLLDDRNAYGNRYIFEIIFQEKKT